MKLHQNANQNKISKSPKWVGKDQWVEQLNPKRVRKIRSLKNSRLRATKAIKMIINLNLKLFMNKILERIWIKKCSPNKYKTYAKKILEYWNKRIYKIKKLDVPKENNKIKITLLFKN